ncbi:MAG: DUF3883 domain-containing protein [Caulobacteraceae bacterium]
MADQSKIGTVWEDDELDAIVADYFTMLAAEQDGRPYVKSHHSLALMDKIGRTHRSVEFKHMNISAVLGNLGLPTIKGYKAKINVQNAIYDAIERFLGDYLQSPALDEAIHVGVADTANLFEEPPPTANFSSRAVSPRMERLMRKFDAGERDSRNKILGKKGEALVFDFERERLARDDRRDLAANVGWVSQEDGDGAGYDILSFDAAGRERLIEVKTTRGPQTTPFFLTRNERAVSEERPDAFRIYRIYEFSEAPKLFKLYPPLDHAVLLEPETYRASFG